jgi:hypothetical protein
MSDNTITKAIQMIKLFDRTGTKSITSVSDASKLVDMIPINDRLNPKTTYQDTQCGTGLLVLVLAQQLMIDLKKAIPDSTNRVKHIFENQIYLSDIDPRQVQIASAIIKRAFNDRNFKINIEVKDCFQIQRQTNYTVGSIEFGTTTKFIPHFKKLSNNVIVITRANKHSLVKQKIYELQGYQFLRRVNNTPSCVLSIPKHKNNKKVTFINGSRSETINDPHIVPLENFDGWRYAEKVLNRKLKGYISNSGPENTKTFNYNNGEIPLVFKGWREDMESKKPLKNKKDKKGGHCVLLIDKESITKNMGYGIPKLLVPKNANPGCIPKFWYDKNGELACSGQVNWIAMTEKEYNKLTVAIKNDPCYNTLFKAVLVKTHTKDFWSKIPKIKYFKTVKKIHNEYYKRNCK